MNSSAKAFAASGQPQLLDQAVLQRQVSPLNTALG